MTLPNFQVIGDVTHLTAIVLLPIKLQWSMDASGVSLTTQELYLLVFLTRYLGLFVYSVSLYNSAMKILFVSYTAMTIAMLRFQPSLKASCEKSGIEGSFRPWLHAVFPSVILATMVCLWDFGFEIHGFSSFQAFWWTFSEILEPLAIVPQLLVLRRSRNNAAGVVTWCYVPLMAVYRALYILAWMQTTRDEPRCAHQYLLYFAALTQTFIYVLFFADRFYCRRDRDRRAPVESDGGGAMEIEAGFYGARQRLLPYFSSSPSALSFSSDSGAYFGVSSNDSQGHQQEIRRRDEEWA